MEGKQCRSKILAAEINRVRKNSRALRIQKEGLGAYVMPWAKDMFKMGKPVRKPDAGILGPVRPKW